MDNLVSKDKKESLKKIPCRKNFLFVKVVATVPEPRDIVCTLHTATINYIKYFNNVFKVCKRCVLLKVISNKC